jgi:hypothetical protein
MNLLTAVAVPASSPLLERVSVRDVEQHEWGVLIRTPAGGAATRSPLVPPVTGAVPEGRRRVVP